MLVLTAHQVVIGRTHSWRGMDTGALHPQGMSDCGAADAADFIERQRATGLRHVVGGGAAEKFA